jgi:hypothetical protein
MKLGISHHFFEKENRAEKRLNKHTGELSNLWAFAQFQTVDLEPEGIAKHVLSGKAISVGACRNNWRKEENFISSQIMGLDFDDHTSVKDCMSDPFIERHAFLIYATPSSTPEKPRSRALFALDEAIMDADTYRRFIKRLAWHTKAGMADPQCLEPVRIFYGSKTDEYSPDWSVRLPLLVLEALPHHPDEDRKPVAITSYKPVNLKDPLEKARYEAYAAKTRREIIATLSTMPDGMDLRHGAINEATMKLAAFSKGGWIGFEGWEDEIRAIGRAWGRTTQEIEEGIRGAYRKASPRVMHLEDRVRTMPKLESTNGKKSREEVTILTSHEGEQSDTSEVTWRSSDESMERYRNRLGGMVDPGMTPLIFPMKCLHRKGGFCVAIPPGVLIGIVGMSGGLKTSFLETITEMWRMIDEADVLWWGIEWSWEKMADRAVQRLGTVERPTPTVHQMMLHEIWTAEEAANIPMAKRNGKRMAENLKKNAEWATEQIERWKGKCHYIEEVDLDIDTLLARSAERVDQERARGRNVRVAVWDYVQLLNMRGVNKEDERISAALGRLKAFCIEKKLIGLTASQVTKASAFNARNGDDVLEAESGQNFRGDKFNLVLTLNPIYKGKTITNRAIINVSKNSAGETGEVMTYIDPARYKWLDGISEDEKEDDKFETDSVPF